MILMIGMVGTEATRLSVLGAVCEPVRRGSRGNRPLLNEVA